MKEEAINNVSYWLGVSKKNAQLLINNSIEINSNPDIHFWFYRSLALNKNISNKPMTGTIDFGFLQKFMQDYFQRHTSLDGNWNSYESIEMFISEFTPSSLNTPTGIPNWLKGLYDVPYLDVLVYPCFNESSDKSKILGSIVSNYILNNQEKVIESFGFQLRYYTKVKEYNNLTVKAVSSKNLSVESNLINTALTPLGVQLLIQRGLQYELPILKDSLKFLKKEGLVFPENLPLFPVGFDLMLAQNNIIDNVSISKIWS